MRLTSPNYFWKIYPEKNASTIPAFFCILLIILKMSHRINLFKPPNRRGFCMGRSISDKPTNKTRRSLYHVWHYLSQQYLSVLVQELVSWIWWLSVVSTLFYVVFFAVGPGSIPWMITAELFSQGPRPAAMSVAVLINWCANFLVAIGFPTMQVTN